MKILTTSLVGLLLGVTAPVLAAPTPCDPPKPAKPHKPKTPKKPVKPPEKPCDCQPGKDGKDGKDGEDGGVIIQVQPVVIFEKVTTPGLSVRPGVMGSVHAPHGDWAWGPALQLAQPVGTRGEFVVDVGIALPADGWIGNERGLLLHAGYARVITKHVGLTAGVHATTIDGSPDNGNISGGYLGIDAGVVLRNNRFRVELTPVISGLRDDNESGTQFSIGLAGSVFVSI